MDAPRKMTVAELINILSRYPNNSIVELTSGSISVISWSSLTVDEETVMENV